MKKKIGLLVLLIVVAGVGKYVYDMNINHNFETITEGKVYKSGVIPPDEIESYVKKYNIKSIVDLRMPGTNDLVLNPEQPGELQQEKEAVAKIKGVNYYSNPSDQVPTQDKVDSFLKIMDNPDNYPVLIHCYHGTGRAEMYSALYRIEYEDADRDDARERTRFLTKWSSFDLGKPKGDYLHAYESRKEKAKLATK
ncbi:dual specificity protein phosphatase [Flavobacterium limnosediminis JC2902]|uniref:Dual specificity protein phosphatase n=1 Tax=Flavobacterium limnosediminis JC2902 TaxID=1341181 RepID=V6SP65_9FLAO|nr:dual specificity protein phosphatase family protein [Flavobacterium limnosediminis]ESU28416.1 dual specificity protein phosphatase [Flavobacterium limnosediminis JC2902]